MPSFPSITIVTPSYNQAKYIEKTIESVLAQNYPRLEYLIFDGGSTDKTVEILKRYEKHLTYWVAEKDRGQSHAINKGLARATGEIFNWLNSDDVLEPGALLEIASLWQSGKTDLLCGASVDIIAQTGQTKTWGPGEPTRLSSFLGHRAYIPHAQPSTFLNTQWLKETGGVREDLHFRMDWELYLRLMISKRKHFHFQSTKKILSRSLHHGNTKTNLRGGEFDGEAKKILHEMMPQFLWQERLKANHFLRRQNVQNEIIKAREGTAALGALTKLLWRLPSSALYRFFWGAIFQEIRK